MNIERRIERAEEALGIDDEMVELDFGAGERFAMTGRELTELLHKIEGTRILPRDTIPVRLPTDTDYDGN